MRSYLLILLAGACLAPAAAQAPSAGLAQHYRDVLVPPLAQSATVENVAFQWAGLTFVLRRGQLALASAIAGHRTAAVFIGAGELDVTPADSAERGQIALRHAGSDHLAEPFTQAVFRFADSAAFERALADQVHFRDGPGAPALAALLSQRAHALVASGSPDGARILAALAAPPVALSPLLLAELKTSDAGWLRAQADPWQPATVRVSAWMVRPWSDSSQIATSLLRWQYTEPSVEIGGAAPNANVSALDPNSAADTAASVGDSFVGYSSITDDPTAEKAMHPSTAGDKPFAGFDDTWTAFSPAGLPAREPFEMRSYSVEVKVNGAYDLAGNLPADIRATLEVNPLQPLGNALMLRLNSQLRVSSVLGDGGEPVAFLQPPDPGDPADPGYQGNWLYVELPAAMAAGSPARLTVVYRGKLFEDLGAGNYLFRGQDWLPAALYASTPQFAAYDLKFTTDRKWTVAASGERIASVRDGDNQTSEWKSAGPLSGAGFVLGDLAEIAFAAPKPAAGAPAAPLLRAVVNRRPDMAFSQIAASVFAAQNAPASASPAALKRQTPNYGIAPPTGASGQSLGTVDSAPALLAMGTLTPVTAAPGVLAEVDNELRFLIRLFGPFPYPALTINNLPSRIVSAPQRESPAWPGLVCLSNATFLDSLQQHVLGLDGTQQRQLEYLSGAHLLAHQWWNGAVGWSTPADEWLGEGLANGAMLLYEESRLGEDAAQATLRQWHADLLASDSSGLVPEQLGPLTLGNRLRSPRDPNGFDLVAGDKGGYVIYMLRELMRNPRATDPDAGFLAALHEFAAGSIGHGATTANFQAALERHMTAGMDLDGDRSLDWFFSQYVRGTGVPRLRFHAVSTDSGAQASVALDVGNPGLWHGVLPVYIFSAPGESVRVLVRITAAQNHVVVPVPFHPLKVEANRNQDMLLVVEAY